MITWKFIRRYAINEGQTKTKYSGNTKLKIHLSFNIYNLKNATRFTVLI